MSHELTQEELDYRSRQLNHEDVIGQMMLDNHSDQLNPNNSRYANNDDDWDDYYDGNQNDDDDFWVGGFMYSDEY